MRQFTKDDLARIKLPGRAIQKAIGLESFSKSVEMTVGFATYSKEYGPMEPHHHAEEVVYVLDAKDAWVEFGIERNELTNRSPLRPGDVLHFAELEWHVFKYGDAGYLDIIFIYGRVNNIRPEEITIESEN